VSIEILETVTKTIGSLALAYPYLRRLRLAEILTELTTRGKGRQVPTGQVIEVLVLNRLALQPSPISKVADWARLQAIEEVYGLAPETLNDDRIGRALDEIHPHLKDAWAALVLTGAQAYGVRLDQLHSDVTRVAFEGSYDEAPATAPDGRPVARIAHGYSGKQDPNRKQLTVSLSVTADGALPAWYQPGDGNAADTGTYLAHLTALRERLHLDRPLIVGDSKLVTRPNLVGFCRVGARFIGPTRLTAAERQTLRTLWAAGEPFWRLDLPPGAAPDQSAPARYWGLECPEELSDPERGTSYRLRRLFVLSRDDRRAVRHQRAKDLARAHRALWTIRRRVDRRVPAYRDRSCVQRKVAEALTKVRAFIEAHVVETPSGLDIRWRLDRARLREEADFDGVYCLLTNEAPAGTPLQTLQEVFRAYKGQSHVEGRFRTFKHLPVQVRPLWLHQPHRIESLLFVVMVALFLFALIEREARRVVQQSGQVFTGLRPEGRDRLPVTTTRLLEVFAPLSLVKQRLRVAGTLVEVLTPATLTTIQAQILDRLGLTRPDAYLHSVISPHPP
jgi:transposase